MREDPNRDDLLFFVRSSASVAVLVLCSTARQTQPHAVPVSVYLGLIACESGIHKVEPTAMMAVAFGLSLQIERILIRSGTMVVKATLEDALTQDPKDDHRETEDRKLWHSVET